MKFEVELATECKLEPNNSQIQLRNWDSHSD